MFTNDMLSKKNLLEDIKMMINQEKPEDLQELSKNTLYSYRIKAKAQLDTPKPKGRHSNATKKMIEKRTAGIASAGKKIDSANEAEYQAHNKKCLEVDHHIRSIVPVALKKHGFTKVIDHPSKEIWTKPDHENGKIIHAIIPRNSMPHNPDYVKPDYVKYTNSDNTSYSDSGFRPDHYAHRKDSIEEHKKGIEDKLHSHMKKNIERLSEKNFWEEVNIEEVENLLSEDFSQNEIKKIKNILTKEEGQ